MDTAVADGALSGLRVLDLGHGIVGPFAARLLGDLGAEVIKVEGPRGDFARRLPPICEGRDGSESALFSYLNWNKKSVVIDLDAPGAAEQLEPLIRASDVVIESFRPGRLDRWGVGYDTMARWNPGLVLTSVSNFGQKGPWAQFAATDLIFYATSGMMSVSGNKHPLPPLKHGLRQSLYCAGLTAAYASLAGLVLAARTARGEHIDVSIRDCLVSGATATATANYVFLGLVAGRNPIRQDPFGGDPIDASDGFVAMQTNRAAPMHRYAEVLNVDELLDERFATDEGRTRNAEDLRSLLEKRLASESAIGFFERASEEGLEVGVLQGAKELLGSSQLTARRAFASIADETSHADLRYPVGLARPMRSPVLKLRPAPYLGEHTKEVLGRHRSAATGIAIAEGEIARLGGAGEAATSRLPFSGMRVLELSQAIAAPYMGALLADLGAEVIKVEGPARPDLTRGSTSLYIDNEPGNEPWNHAARFQGMNRGKRSFVCDLEHPEGQLALHDLLARCDILIENFTPRVLPKWGLTPDVLIALNPRLIVISNSGFGGTGPWRDFCAVGATIEPTTGFSYYTGYEGARPSKVGEAYPDFVACWAGLIPLLAALIKRLRTGEGDRIDQGMYQLGSVIIPEAILHYQLAGEELPRLGNKDLTSLVSGTFESAQRDVWVAISVRDAADLLHLAAVFPEIAPFCDATSLSANQVTAVTTALTAWAAERSADELVAELQAIRVPAGRVLNIDELFADEQLITRNFYEEVEYPGVGARPVVGRPYRFCTAEDAGVGPHIARRAPDYGADIRYVLGELLERTEEQIEHLYETGVVAEIPTKSASAVPTDLDTLVAKGSFARIDARYRTRFANRRHDDMMRG